MKRFLITIVILTGILSVGSGSTLSPLASATLLTPPKPLEEFALVDTTGATFTQKSLLGHWSLMFFGYTECPNTCPKTLAILSETWKLLSQGQTLTPIRFVFVSLDPKSDTPQKLRPFLEGFHSDFMGLTGEENVVQNLSKNCHIYHWQDSNSKPGNKIIDHSATLLLIDPQGHIKALFSPPYEKETLAKDLQALLKS